MKYYAVQWFRKNRLETNIRFQHLSEAVQAYRDRLWTASLGQHPAPSIIEVNDGIWRDISATLSR